jgi:peptide chain release factor 3
LQSEYNAECRLTPTPWTVLRWLSLADGTTAGLAKGTIDYSKFVVASGVSFGTDKFDQPVVLFPNEWTMRYFSDKNPELKLHELPLEQSLS